MEGGERRGEEEARGRGLEGGRKGEGLFSRMLVYKNF